MSCLVAVRGPAPWYKLIKVGTNVVDAKSGVNIWKSDGNREHSYLVLKSDNKTKAKVKQALEDLQTAGQTRPTGLKFNTSYYADAGMGWITSQGDEDSSSAATEAFDHDEKSAWLDKAASSWIQCQYADGRKYRATSYTVVCLDKDRLPATLKLAGSNDGVRWTDLDVQTDLDFDERTLRREFTLANTAKWNRYRLAVTAKDVQEGVRIATVELNEIIDCRPKTAVTDLILDQEELTLAVHTRATLNAMLAPLNSFEREVTWVSSDPTVVEVKKIGEQVAIVVGKKPGKCTITASTDKMKHLCSVTVTPSTLPVGWHYDELNTPAIPGSIYMRDGTFALTGCGHAMTSWWERVRDQGAFISKPAPGDFDISARLASLSRNVGGPDAYHADNRPPTAAGLMVRESLDEQASRYFLVQVEATGNLVCRWRDKTADQDDNQSQGLGKIALPSHLRLFRSGRLSFRSKATCAACASIRFRARESFKSSGSVLSTRLEKTEPGAARTSPFTRFHRRR